MKCDASKVSGVESEESCKAWLSLKALGWQLTSVRGRGVVFQVEVGLLNGIRRQRVNVYFQPRCPASPWKTTKTKKWKLRRGAQPQLVLSKQLRVLFAAVHDDDGRSSRVDGSRKCSHES